MTNTLQRPGGGSGDRLGPPTRPDQVDGSSGQAGTTRSTGALPRLLGRSVEEFATHYWGQQALLTPAAELPLPFTDLLTSDDVDELVSERGLRTPFLRVARAGSTLPERLFTAPGGVGAGIGDQVSDDKLVGLFADGSTLVLQALHRVWPPIVEFCQELAADLGHPVQANAYLTPPQNQGFSDHYDVHDVFVLQLEGEKRWQIHAPVLESPLRDQPWSDRRRAVEQRAQEEPLIETVLRPGDCLYLPRGFLHAATALGGVSAHLTIGVHPWTRFALAEQLMEQALRAAGSQPDVRGSLDLGVDFADVESVRGDVERARAALIAALQSADPAVVAAAMSRSARSSQRSAPIGPLRQLRDAERLAPERLLTLRRHVAAVVAETAGRTVLRARTGDFPLEPADVEPVRSLLDQGALRADQLGLDLARRLLLAGLLVVE